jgi:hypothetical protein
VSPTPTPSDFQTYKSQLMKQFGGNEKLARARGLLFSMLWNLEAGVPPQILIDCLELLRFELARKLAEGEPP